MEKNVTQVILSSELKSASEELIERAVKNAALLRKQTEATKLSRAGRKAHKLEIDS